MVQAVAPQVFGQRGDVPLPQQLFRLRDELGDAGWHPAILRWNAMIAGSGT